MKLIKERYNQEKVSFSLIEYLLINFGLWLRRSKLEYFRIIGYHFLQKILPEYVKLDYSLIYKNPNYFCNNNYVIPGKLTGIFWEEHNKYCYILRKNFKIHLL